MIPRDMDCIVAEHVMGWGWYTRSCYEGRWFGPKETAAMPTHPSSGEVRACTVEDMAKAPEAAWWIERGVEGVEPRVPRYTTEIADAWLFREEVKTWLFSRRLAFKETLQSVISHRMGMTDDVHSSEVFLLVKPQDICAAALFTVGQIAATDELVGMKIQTTTEYNL